jgi:hypothetical protein
MQFQCKRRELIAFLGATIAAWPLAARGQPAGTVSRIGFLTPRTRPSPPGHDAFSDAFIKGMSKLGYTEERICWSSGAMPTAITPASPGSRKS